MQIGTFMKGALAGGVGATVVMGATAALAGNGIGAVFNLGQTNTVNATSTLTGAKAGPMLQVTNTSATDPATGIGITVPTTRPPLVLNSKKVVTNLNADLVDGYSASALTRAGQGATPSPDVYERTDTQATATIVMPVNGYVRLVGIVAASDASHACNYCYPNMTLRDDASGEESPSAITALGHPDGAVDVQQLAQTWTFAAAKGTHTYSLRTGQGLVNGETGATSFYNPVLTAELLPFGHAGGGTGLAPAPGPNAAAPAMVPPGSPLGPGSGR